MKNIFKGLLLIIILNIFIFDVNAKEIQIYFDANRGTTKTKGFSVEQNSIIHDKTGRSDATYSGDGQTVISKINSIDGVTFTLQRSGYSMEQGKEWYALNRRENNKKVYFSQSKTYTIDEFSSMLGEDGEYIIVNLYANWKSNTSTSSINSTTTIKMEKSSISIKKGESTKIKSTVTNSNSTTTIKWTSSNPKVAKVDSNGKVTAIKEGKATIKATTGNGKSDSCIIKVEDPNYVIIKYHLNGGKLAKKKGDAITSKWEKVYCHNDTVCQKVESDSKLNKNGLINYNNENYLNVEKNNYTVTSSKEWNTKSNGKGKTYSQSKQYKASDFCDASKKDCTVDLYVNWQDILVSKVQLEKTSINLKNGDKTTVKATVTPTNATDSSLEWKSSNTKVVKVDKNGKITAKGNGNATITATSNNNKKATLNVSVKNYVLIRYHMNGGSLSSNRSNKISSKKDMILCNSNEICQKIEYGGTADLTNYNNSDYINIARKNYKIYSNDEWNSKANGTGTAYSQSKKYKASDFCDASKGNCTVDLYANWKQNDKILGTIDLTSAKCLNVPTSGSCSSAQGFVVAGNYYVAAKRNGNESQVNIHVIKRKNGKQVNKLTVNKDLGHANAIAYDSKRKKIYIGMTNKKSYGIYKYSDITKSNANISWGTMKTNTRSYSPTAIEYSSSNDYIYAVSGWYILGYPASKISKAPKTQIIKRLRYTAQDIGSYKGYILVLRYDENRSSAGGNPIIGTTRNELDVYNASTGEYKGTYFIKTAGEVEGLSYTGSGVNFGFFVNNTYNPNKDYDCIFTQNISNLNNVK